MKSLYTRITTEQIFHSAVFLVALLIRFLQLGTLPLGDNEARLALQAFEMAGGRNPQVLDAEPGYLVGTTGLFFLFIATNFLARLVPALFGAGLCLLPYFARDWLGRKSALILAVLLAFDPGWIMASRQAGGATWAVFFTGLFVLGLLRRQPRLAGLAAGLAMLGGIGLWKLLVPFGLALWLFPRISKNEEAAVWLPGKLGDLDWKKALAWGVGTMLVSGSLLLLLPQGLSAAVGSILAYFRGGGGAGTFSAGLLLLAVLVYQPFGWVFGLARVIRQVKHPSALDRFLSLWWLIALIAGLLYPARQPLDILWSSIPMLILSARMLEEILRFDFEQKRVAIIYGVVVLLLWLFATQNLARLLNNLQFNSSLQMPLIGIIAAVFFILASLVLMGWGWSVRVATMGSVWGSTAFLALFALAAAWHTTGMGSRPETRLLASEPSKPDADLLMGTIGDLSEWNTGIRNQLEVMIIDLDQPSMRWLFRDYNQIAFEKVIPPQAEPALVLTPANISPSFTLPYRGQDFTWSVVPRWDLMIGVEWLDWMVFRNAPVDSQMILLWARENVFPGAESQP